MVTSMTYQKETGVLERFSYSFYFVGQNVAYQMIQGYLLMFYVSYLQIRPALVASVFLAVRIWDAVNDPMIGVAMDRFRFRRSRFKGWLTFTAFAMPAATFALFLTPPSASMALKIGLMIGTYVIWDVLYTVSEVPSFAAATTMANTERERTLLLTLTQIGSVAGTAAGMGIAFFFLADGVDAVNWTMFALTPTLFAVLLMAPQIFTVRERHIPPQTDGISLRKMIREVARNDQHFIMMALYASQAFLNAASVFAVYVAEAVYGNAQLASLTGVFSLVGIMGLGAATPAIVGRWGKRRYLEISMLLCIVLSIPIFFVPGTRPVVAMVFLGMRSIALIVTTLLRPMFTADCIEYGQHKTGIRSESAAFAVQTLFNKTGDALGGSLGALVLALALFDEARPLAEQSAGTIRFLWLAYIILPMIMAALMYLGPKLWYKLDEETVSGYITENEQKANATRPEAS